jgi:hypothetical protein
MGEAVALASGSVPVEGDGALAVEMHGGDVLVEVIEHGGQRLSSVQFLTRFGGRQVIEHQETGVLGEQSHLTLGVARVRAVRVGVEQLPDGEPVGGFGASDRCMGGHGESSSLVSVIRPAANSLDARPVRWLIPRLLWMLLGWR